MNRTKITNTKVRLWIGTFLAVLGSGFATPARSETLTLPEIAKIVLDVNAAIESAEAQAQEAQSHVAHARASYLPGISISGAYTHGNNPVYAFGTLLGQSRFELGDFRLDRLNHPSALANLQGQAGFRMQIINWQRKRQVQAARAGSQAAQEFKQVVRQQLLGQTIEAFYGLMLARKQSGILRERIQESEEALKNATRLKKQGLVLGSDYHLARALLGQLKQQLVQTTSRIHSAQAALNVMMSRRENTMLTISGMIELADPPPLDPGLLSDNLNRHPLFRNALYSAEGANASAKAESRANWPLFSGFSVIEGNGYKIDSGGWNYLTGVKLTMPLFDPGHEPRIKLKRSSALRMESGRKIIEDNLRVNLHRKFQTYESARNRLDLAIQTEKEARRALSMFKKLHRSGRQSIADVMQGEMSLAQSQVGLQQVHFDLRVGYARTLQAAGVLKKIPEIYAR